MEIFWQGVEIKTENSYPYQTRAIMGAARQKKSGPYVIVEPLQPYEGKGFQFKRSFIELYGNQHFTKPEVKTWATPAIKNQVSIVAGFGYEAGLKICHASVIDEMPKGASGARIAYLLGPNLNLLGKAGAENFGMQTLRAIFDNISENNPEIELRVIQSNSEGELIQHIHAARDSFDAIIIDAGAYASTSIAIADALDAFEDVVIETQFLNPYQRESFRHNSHIARVADGVIYGFRARTYELALMGAMSKL